MRKEGGMRKTKRAGGKKQVRKSVNYALVILIFLVVAAGLLLWLDGFFLPRVEISDNTIVRSSYCFLFEHWSEEKLLQLYRSEDFKDISAKTQLELFLRLCNWTHKQWVSSMPDPYPLCNAIDILRDIRAGKAGGFCAQYAYVLADVLKASGFFCVRYVELDSPEGREHFVIEVWSDEFAKWMVLDPHYNVYFRLQEANLPANAYEVRASLYGGRKVEVVAIDEKDKYDAEHQKALYANFAVSLRSDLMRHPGPLTFYDRYATFLFFRDKHTGPPFDEKIPYRKVTRRLKDIYYDCNKVRMEATRHRKYVDFHLNTDGSMPNFKAFMIKRGPDSPWEETRSRIRVDAIDGSSAFWVAAVNHHNRLGVINSVRIHW